MYKVDISPAANAVLEDYSLRCASDNGTECALRLLDAFDEKRRLSRNHPDDWMRQIKIYSFPNIA